MQISYTFNPKRRSETIVGFIIRATKPGAGNKYYITKQNGGYSNAIRGYPTDSECDVLANCVGYAYGRFNEIGEYGYCKYLAPVNAERFIDFAGGCKTGMTPKNGACMVWARGSKFSPDDGAGHVAIVERVISETEVYTSESGYGAKKPFWNQNRKKGDDGNWGESSPYKFLGFIYNPAVTEGTDETPVKEGAVVRIRDGATYYYGQAVPKWVSDREWIVRKVDGDRIFVDKSVDGIFSINSPVNVRSLDFVSESPVKIEFPEYKVKVTATVLNIRSGPGTDYDITGRIIDKGIYTIVGECEGIGASLWGKLKSGIGWISLEYTERV